MDIRRDWITNPTRRRSALLFVSGSLIAAGLTAGYLLGLPGPQAMLMSLAALVAGADVAERAIGGLRQRQITIELLVVIAAAGALGIGESWEAAAVTFLFLLGAQLETWTLGRTRRALSQLLELAPQVAFVVRGGEVVEVAPDAVELGETVLVRPGARIPVDGRVMRGHAVIDESMITGESTPADKNDGDAVFAGTVCQTGTIWLQATRIGIDTTLARIIQRVEEAQEEKAPAQRSIERFARWYTPAIIVASFAVFALTQDISRALTLLVIGCPGALVISTPVSVVAGIGQAARRGILIKGGEHLEAAGRISALLFDKTGTLTEGKPQVTTVLALAPDLIPAGSISTSPVTDRGTNEEDVLRWAAIAEATSQHPFAAPILAAAAPFGPAATPDAVEDITGLGVQARYQGHDVVAGNAEMMRVAGISLGPDVVEALGGLRRDGQSGVIIALDNQVIGLIGLTAEPRATAPLMIDRLHRLGIQRIAMLTGDALRVARDIAARVGIDEVYAGLLPDEKVAYVRQLRQEGQVVAMVGDGVNDAPALATADVGIALGVAATDIAAETADIVLMTDDLTKIAEAVHIARSTLRNVHQNIGIALLTVTGLIIAVLAGDVQMAGGMLIHQLSVLAVILNAMRLMRVKGEDHPAILPARVRR